jgi:predicted nucleic acid-binding protein
VKISDALAGVQRLCVDTAPFIYYVERYPAYTHKMRAVFQLANDRPFSIFTSVVTLTETLTKPLRVNDTALIREYRELFQNTQRFALVSVDAIIAGRAAGLRAQYNLKTPDALQLAVAIQTVCDAFLTNDQSLKRVTETRVLILDELELGNP